MKDYKKDFKWFENNPNITFLDSAAGSLKPQCVIDAINEYYLVQATNPHNDDSLFSHQAHHVMTECRVAAAKLINCEPEEVIFTSGATESLMLTAQSIKHLLKKDDEVILTRIEHASNLLPWYELRDELGIKIRFLEQDGLAVNTESIKKLLNEKTKVVSITGGSNLSGIIVDVDKIAEIVKSYNKDIILSVDIAQRIVHAPSDAKKWDADFISFSSNKMYGPTGSGICYVKKSLQSIINPLRYGGGMNSTITEQDFCYINGVQKFEGGTPHIAGIYGFLKAIEYLQAIGYDNIAQKERENWEYFKKKFEALNNPDLIWINKDYNTSTFIIKYKGVFPQDLAHYLGNNNIIVRSGLSCAKLMKDIIQDVGVVRISTAIYTSYEDFDKLFDALAKFKKSDVLNGLV